MSIIRKTMCKMVLLMMNTLTAKDEKTYAFLKGKY
jgi:hypothetical protein